MAFCWPLFFFVPLLFVIFEIVLGFTTSHYPFGILLPIRPEHLNTLPVRPEHLNAFPVRVAQYFCVVLSLVSYQTAYSSRAPECSPGSCWSVFLCTCSSFFGILPSSAYSSRAPECSPGSCCSVFLCSYFWTIVSLCLFFILAVVVFVLQFTVFYPFGIFKLFFNALRSIIHSIAIFAFLLKNFSSRDATTPNVSPNGNHFVEHHMVFYIWKITQTLPG